MAPKSGKWAVSTNGKQSQSINNGEVKCKTSYYDKQSGSYGHVTNKESVSSGGYTNRGRSGHKDEYKAKSTVRVGGKRGYTEYSKEEKLTWVDYGGASNSYGGNKVCWGGGNVEDDDYSGSDDDCGADSNNDSDSAADVSTDDDSDDEVSGSDGSSDDVDDDSNIDDDDGCSDDCYDSDDGGCSDDYYDSDD